MVIFSCNRRSSYEFTTAKKALRLEQKDDVSTVLSVNAATVTDNYWIKPIHDEITTYQDVRFTVNHFDNLALTGDINSFIQQPSRSPELTNIGSFEKFWKLINGKWWMIKSGKPEELFSELLICRIAKFLDFPVAEYKPDGNHINNLDFTNGAEVDFEPANAIIGNESDYIKIYNMLKPFGKQITTAYLQMCYLDALVINMDRHEYNFGILRDSDTGEVLSFAPFFDHNIALVSRGYSKVKDFEHDLLINDFTELIHHTKDRLSVAKLTKEVLRDWIKKIPWKLPVTDLVADPIEFTVQYLLKRQERLIELNRDIMKFKSLPSMQYEIG